jgi:hypothetical protein
MTPAERLQRLPGYLAFNGGVMFFIGLASRLTSDGQGAVLNAGQLRVVGFAILLAVLAMASGFASVARIEFAKREGKRFSLAWIAPSVAVGLPLGRALGAGSLDRVTLALAAAGVVGAALAVGWLAFRARTEVKA